MKTISLFSVLPSVLHLQICNNGMITFNLEWTQRYPYPFGQLSWLRQYGIFAPMWGLSDEITMSLLTDNAEDSDWDEARTKIFHHSYTRSANMDDSTRQILDRAQEDVENSGIP